MKNCWKFFLSFKAPRTNTNIVEDFKRDFTKKSVFEYDCGAWRR